MKKVFSLLILAILMLTVLTGCTDINYNVKINQNGSGDISYTYVIDKEIVESWNYNTEILTLQDKTIAENAGYTIESYAYEGQEGFKATKHFDDITTFSFNELFEGYLNSLENDGIKIETVKDKKVYSQNVSLDLTTLTGTKENVEIKYQVTLPTKVDETNANEVSSDKKTLTWNLLPGQINEIKFEAKETNKFISISRSIIDTIISNVIYLIAAIAVTTIILALIIVLIIKKVKKAKTGPKTEKVAKVKKEKKVKIKKEKEVKVKKEKPTKESKNK